MTESRLKPGWRRVKFGEVVRLSKARCADPLVADIDEIVRQVRFDGWQATSADERLVKQALRKTLAR